MRLGLLAVAVVSLVGATAAATMSLQSRSVLVVSVAPAPLELSAGSGAARTTYMQDFQVSPNRTYFTASFHGKIGGDVMVKDVVRITSKGPDGSVTLKGTRITDPRISAFSWTVRSGSTTIGTIDQLSSSPSLTFTLPAGATFQLDERVKMTKTAGLDRSATPFSLGWAAS